MKYPSGLLITALVLLSYGNLSHAVTVYKCIDAEGNVTIQDHCPADTTKGDTEKIYTGTGPAEDKTDAAKDGKKPAPDVQILFYQVPDCDACTILQSVLKDYKANYTTRNINESDDVKRELQEKIGGSGTLTIPTILVGDKVIAGFKKAELESALEAAGFSKPGAEKPAEGEGESAPATPAAENQDNSATTTATE